MAKNLNSLNLENSLYIGATATNYNFPTSRGSDTQILSTDGSGNINWINPTSVSSSYSITSVSTTPYTILSTDDYIHVDTSSLEITLTLPEITSIGTTNNYKIFTITDINGNATTNNITVNISGSDTINGETSLTINTNFTSIKLKSDGSTKWIII